MLFGVAALHFISSVVSHLHTTQSEHLSWQSMTSHAIYIAYRYSTVNSIEHNDALFFWFRKYSSLGFRSRPAPKPKTVCRRNTDGEPMSKVQRCQMVNKSGGRTRGGYGKKKSYRHRGSLGKNRIHTEWTGHSDMLLTLFGCYKCHGQLLLFKYLGTHDMLLKAQEDP